MFGFTLDEVCSAVLVRFLGAVSSVEMFRFVFSFLLFDLTSSVNSSGKIGIVLQYVYLEKHL